MMSIMGLPRFILILPLLLMACTHAPKLKEMSPATLLPMMHLDGEGKARLEIGEESWVFSYDAGFKEKSWIMALQIPLQGEMVFAFPGLDKSKASISPGPEDFRWRVVHALRETSDKRRLGYPQAGQDFIQKLHHLLRWVKPGAEVPKDCQATSSASWTCIRDGVTSLWTWNSDKEEAQLEFILRPGWKLVAIFRNLTGPIFKRVTIEVIREGQDKKFVELRQELFITTL